MKRILLALALVASPILAEESKPIATQVGSFCLLFRLPR